MADIVTVTVAWTIKPERAEEFVAALAGMFPVTRTHKGFRSIQLLLSASEPDSFLLIEEWDKVEDFNTYGQFRVETGDTARLLDMTVGYPQMSVWVSAPLAEAAI